MFIVDSKGVAKQVEIPKPKLAPPIVRINGKVQEPLPRNKGAEQK